MIWRGAIQFDEQYLDFCSKYATDIIWLLRDCKLVTYLIIFKFFTVEYLILIKINWTLRIYILFIWIELFFYLSHLSQYVQYFMNIFNVKYVMLHYQLYQILKVFFLVFAMLIYNIIYFYYIVLISFILVFSEFQLFTLVYFIIIN